MPGFGPAAEAPSARLRTGLLLPAKGPNTKVSLFETRHATSSRPATFHGTDTGWRANQLAVLRQGPQRHESFEVGGCFNPFLLFFFYEIFFELGEVFDSEGWECIGPVFDSLV